MTQTNGRVASIAMAEIAPDPTQPRKRFDQAALQELSRSIGKNGLLQPITVRKNGTVAPGEPGFIIVAGERRYRATMMLRQEEIDCLVYDGDRARELQLVENVNREDLNPMEAADAYQAYLDAGHSKDDLAEVVGQAKSSISRRLGLLRCLPDVQHLIRRGSLSPLVGFALGRLTHNSQVRALRIMQASNLDISECQQLCDRLFGEENQGDLFPEVPRLSEQEMKVRHKVAVALQRACDALIEIANAEQETPGVVAGALADRLEITQDKLEMLFDLVLKFRRALQERKVQGLF